MAKKKTKTPIKLIITCTTKLFLNKTILEGRHVSVVSLSLLLSLVKSSELFLQEIVTSDTVEFEVRVVMRS